MNLSHVRRVLALAGLALACCVPVATAETVSDGSEEPEGVQALAPRELPEAWQECPDDCRELPEAWQECRDDCREFPEAWQELLESLADDLDEASLEVVLELLAEVAGNADSLSVASAGRRETGTDPGTSPGAHAGGAPAVRLRAIARSEGSLPATASGGGAFDARNLMRVRAEWPSGLNLGAVVERDAGERDAFDRVGGHIGWTLTGAAGKVSVVAGDLLMEWGQRLVAGTASFGWLVGPRTRDRVRGYDGAAECLSRRGAGGAVEWGDLVVLGAVCETSLDATLDDDGNVTGIRDSGLHVTDSERRGRDVLQESAVALRLTWEASWCRLGASVVRVRYGRPFVRSDDERDRFGFEGDVARVSGLDASGSFGIGRWAAEVATSGAGEWAALATLQARAGRARVLVGAAASTRGFASPLGADPPGASSGGNCGTGWARVTYASGAGWSAWWRGRLVGHPWRTYGEPMPPHLASLGFGGRVRLGVRAELTARVSVRSERGTTAAPYASEHVEERRERLRLSAGREPRWSAWCARSSRTVDGSGTGHATATGCALTWTPAGGRTRIDVGAVITAGAGDAPNIHVSEGPLPGGFGLRALKRAGAGWYIRATRTLPAGLRFTARASRDGADGALDLGIALEFDR